MKILIDWKNRFLTIIGAFANKTTKIFIYREDPTTVMIGSLTNPSVTDWFVEEYRRQITANPNNAGAHFFLGNAFEAKGDIAEARLEWETVLRTGETEWHQFAQDSLRRLDGQ